jgi:hypothetical protein
MRSGKLPASSARHAGDKVERNRTVREIEAVRNEGKLAESGTTKGVASGC